MGGRLTQISQVLLLRVENLTEALHRFAPMAHMDSALWGGRLTRIPLTGFALWVGNLTEFCGCLGALIIGALGALGALGNLLTRCLVDSLVF